MDPLLQVKLNARRLAVVEADGYRCVYQLRRVDPMDLLRSGLADVPGLADVAGAGDAALIAMERQQRLNDARTDEERAQVEEALVARAVEAARAQLAAVAGTPDGVALLFERCAVFLTNGIDAMGIAREALEDGTPIPEGLVDPGLSPTDVCRPFSLTPGGPEDQLLRPVKLVREVTGRDQLAISDLGGEVGMKLVGLVTSAFGGGGKIARTFRGEPRAGRADRHLGAKVQAAPKLVPGADAGASGGGGRGARRGQGGGRAKGK